MQRPHLLVLLACLCSCSINGIEPKPNGAGPTFSGFLPLPAQDKPEAPDETTLPVGVGMTFGPNAFLVGGTLDFPLDKKITFGPSVQYGIDDDNKLLTVTGQVKYFLKMEKNEKGEFPILPYVTGGIGAASVDTEGRSSETGVVLDIGAGLRYLTGKHYRLGSEGRLNFFPDSLSGESSYFSVELLQIVITF
jgi:hypothetical protein